MITQILYIMATTSLLIGSVLTFNENLADYFYLVGTCLFVLNSILNFIKKYRYHQRMNNADLDYILNDTYENYI